jgi:hypothetical protein
MIDGPQFLELSLPASEVRESLAWYSALGFGEHETRDVHSYHYAVVSISGICIGLHAERVTAPGLSFVRPELARYVRNEELHGRVFDYAAIGEDQFHEARLADPDGTLAIMLEARTFSPATPDEASALLTGPVERIRLPCMRLHDSIKFWQDNGFIVVESDSEGTAELHTPGLSVELREGTRHVELLFAPAEPQQCLHELTANKIAFRPTAEGHELIAPEGTRLIVQDLPRN